MSECVKVLRDELPYNLHIFVNSVEFIAKVIDTLKLAPEAVKVVCSTRAGRVGRRTSAN